MTAAPAAAPPSGLPANRAPSPPGSAARSHMPSNSHCLDTVSLALPGSIISRFVSRGSSRFFFQPVQLELELADLLIQSRLMFLVVLRPSRAAIGKHLLQPLDGLLLPTRDLIGMHAESACQFRDRAFTANSRQGHLRLESLRKRPAFSRHSFASWSPDSSSANPPYSRARKSPTIIPARTEPPSIAGVPGRFRRSPSRRISTTSFNARRPSLSLQAAPIDLLCRAIVSLTTFQNRQFFFLIDEYENLLDYQQQVVNTLIKHASDLYSFKVGVRELGWRCHSTLNPNEQLVHPADYARISIADKLQGEVFKQFAFRGVTSD